MLKKTNIAIDTYNERGRQNNQWQPEQIKQMLRVRFESCRENTNKEKVSLNHG